jgi:hypothetical protein
VATLLQLQSSVNVSALGGALFPDNFSVFKMGARTLHHCKKRLRREAKALGVANNVVG